MVILEQNFLSTYNGVIRQWLDGQEVKDIDEARFLKSQNVLMRVAGTPTVDQLLSSNGDTKQFPVQVKMSRKSSRMSVLLSKWLFGDNNG